MPNELDSSRILAIVEEKGKSKEHLLSILLAIQNASGKNYVQEEWAKIVATELNLSFSMVYDVLTFYSMFSTKPRGRHVIEICKSTPCYISKSDVIAKIFEKHLGIKVGETTKDQQFTLLYTACVGACDVGPVAKIGEEIYGDLTEDKINSIIIKYQGE
ncbi:NAD(P)H-dependent oxidoreductase subunit E [Pelosinus sp. UFO1]|uniref:NADH-quinone oxidoreductase subunit NuoE family protein n=1 Tax=Pelosinus sp. UFO1 TaxID=484770 RepID=UPI0004D1B25C|nr:NAD(P)H-dependent oxidoreductase subunit E [Pelosinus sp. UFO1]AIF50939.1 NADH dehydrogenase (quinone) [Pelosinus sp. UFO1]